MSKNKLIIHLDGSSEKFINYLKNFSKISSSLLLEIDPFNKQFIAKTFSEDKSAVRFSAITFDECNMQVLELGTQDEDSFRIKLGVLVQLPKMIKILERFENDIESDKNNFNIAINYDFIKNSNGETTDCVAENIQFTSNILNMKMDGFRPSEFKYLSDDVFNNKVFKIENPVEFTLAAATIANIVKTSDIIKIDPKKDGLVLYVDGCDVFIKDLTGKDSKGKDIPSNFTYKLGALPSPLGFEVRLPIFRERFIQLLDKVDEDFIVLFGKSSAGEVDRLAMQSTTSATKLVISIINEN